jgi:hypothetical protein
VGADPSRRELLKLAAAAGGLCTGLTGLTACTGETPTGPTTLKGALELAVDSTAAEAVALRSSALSVAAAPSTSSLLRGLLRVIAADHETHLAALGARAPSGSGPTTSASPTAGSGADQLDAEWAAARSALPDGLASTAGGLALLLIRIAAARAEHADLLAEALDRSPHGVLKPESTGAPSPTPAGTAGSSSAAGSSSTATAGGLGPAQTLPVGSSSPTGSTVPASAVTPSPTPSPGSALPSPAEEALNRLLAGEHAAVYAYPMVIARCTGRRRELAEELWQEHQLRREVIRDRLLRAGVAPVQSQPAYAVQRPTSADAAAQLAARIERGLAALAGDVVASAEVGPDRVDGADQLVLAARRTAAWSGVPEALPGAVQATTRPSAQSTGTPTGGPTTTATAS